MDIAHIFPFRLIRIERVHALASQAEAYTRMLCHLPQEHPTEASQDIITILESTCGMLQHLVEHQEVFTSMSAPDQPGPRLDAQESWPATSAAYEERPYVVSHDSESVEVSSMTEAPVPETFFGQPEKIYLEPDPEPSVAAKELIKLRDWVLLAKSGGTTVEPSILEEISRQLARVLAKEGITPLEESGPYDYNRQFVAGVQPTDNPAQDDQVCSTVKPGYLFQGKLVRPQEVIVYAYQHS